MNTNTKHCEEFRRRVQNLVAEVGGPTRAGRILGVTKPTIRNWLQYRHDFRPYVVTQCGPILGMSPEQVDGMLAEVTERAQKVRPTYRRKARPSQKQLTETLRGWR